MNNIRNARTILLNSTNRLSGSFREMMSWKSGGVRKTLLIPAILFFVLSASANGQEKSKFPSPVISAVVNSAGQLTVNVTIPSGHHAYLDTGKNGAYVPITVSWRKFVDAGILKKIPQTVMSPKGIFDNQKQVSILRGAGQFVFSNTDGSWEKGAMLEIKLQIVNESSGLTSPAQIIETQIQ